MADASEPARRRVLLLAPCADGTDVGEARTAFEWIRRIAEHHDVTVLTYHKRNRPPVGPQLEALGLPGLEVVESIDLPVVGRWERFNSLAKPGYVSWYRRARAFIRAALAAPGGEHRWDVAHQLVPLALRYPSPAAGLGIPLIVGPIAGSVPTPTAFRSEVASAAWYTQLRGLDHWRLAHDRLLRRTYESADLVIGAAPYVADTLASAGMRVQQFVVQSEVGVTELAGAGSPASEREATGEAGNLRLLFVGRVIRTKGVRDAVRAMSHLRDLPGVTLDIVGDGEDRAPCEAEAATLGVTDRVTFHGRRPFAEIPSIYAAADAFLFPSFREPSGNVVVEALGYGLPVIAADRGGPAAVVDDTCGVVVPVTTPDQFAAELAAAIRGLATDPRRVLRLGAGAQARIAGSFLWDAKVAWLLARYDEVIDARARRSRSGVGATGPRCP